MNIIVTYDVESERTRTINGFLSEYLGWEQQSVFHGDVSSDEYESIEDWIRSFVETGELVKIYNMTEDETITIGDEQNTSTDTMTDDTDSDMTFPIASLSVDAVRDKNEHVEERLTYLEQEVENTEQSDDESLTAVRETLAIDADDSVVEAIESLQERNERLVNELDGDGDGDDDGDGDGDDDDSSVKFPVNDVHDNENDYTNRRDGVNPLEEY